MKRLLSKLTDSAKEFACLRSVVTAALLVALRTILSLFVSIQLTESVRISISFVCSVVIGACFGPVMGFVCGGVGEILQFVIKPTGAFNPGISLNACLAGFIYGMFFYGKFPKNIPSKDEEVPCKKSKKVVQILSSVLCCGLAAAGLIVLVTNRTYQLEGSLGYIGILLVIASAMLLVLSFSRKFFLPSTVSILALFASLLILYTERKKISAGLDIIWVLGILVVYVLISIARMVWESKMDTGFLVRCILALTFDTILVNMFLGTYWISQLIGTNFWVLFVPRAVKNFVQLPINIILTYYVMYFAKYAIKKEKRS